MEGHFPFLLQRGIATADLPSLLAHHSYPGRHYDQVDALTQGSRLAAGDVEGTANSETGDWNDELNRHPVEQSHPKLVSH